MSFNTFGHLFRVTTFGESHGVAIGCVVDGCPPLLPLAVEDIQRDLDRRRPGQSRFTTQRQEADAVKILSGVMAHPETGAQVTTGTPIALLIEKPISARKIIPTSRTSFGPATPITPMRPNTACAIIAAAGVRRRARPRRGSRPAPSPARSCPA